MQLGSQFGREMLGQDEPNPCSQTIEQAWKTKSVICLTLPHSVILRKLGEPLAQQSLYLLPTDY